MTSLDYSEAIRQLDQEQLLVRSEVGPKAANLNLLLNADASGTTLRSLDVEVPPGFVVIAPAVQSILSFNGVDKLVNRVLATLDGTRGRTMEVALELTQAISRIEFPVPFRSAVSEAISELQRHGVQRQGVQQYGVHRSWLAVRSSASIEDSDISSFAGHFSSVLDVRLDGEDNQRPVEAAFTEVVGSTFDDRALSGYQMMGIDPAGVSMAVIVQAMVTSDSVGGVALTNEDGSVTVEAALGGAAPVVGGMVDPTRYSVRETGPVRATGPTGETGPLPTSVLADVGALARFVDRVFDSRVDIEWTWDPAENRLFLLQARRLVTVKHPGLSGSTASATGVTARPPNTTGEPLLEGLAVGTGEVTGATLVARSVDEALVTLDQRPVDEKFILVVPTTSPEWIPILGYASAIITDIGGLSSHTAIVSRELGIPAVVGCRDATALLGRPGAPKTVRVRIDGDRGVVLGT